MWWRLDGLNCLSTIVDWISTCLSGIMRAYNAHYVFFIVFQMACISKDFAFREKIMIVVDRLYNPIMARWHGIQWWRFVSTYNSVDASFLDELEVNMKRIQLLERLRVMRLFIFRGVSPTTFIVRNEVRVLQNWWVYYQILKVILADRIMVLWKDREGLPEMSRDYRLLNATENPIYFSSFWKNRKLLDGKTFV